MTDSPEVPTADDSPSASDEPQLLDPAALDATIPADPTALPPAEDATAAEALPVEAQGEAVLPTLVARPRRSLREWLFRTEEMRTRRAELSADAVRDAAIARARAALAQGRIVARPIDPRPGENVAPLAASLLVEALHWALVAQPECASGQTSASVLGAAAGGELGVVVASAAGGEAAAARVLATAAEGFVGRAERSRAEVASDSVLLGETVERLVARVDGPRRELDRLRVTRAIRLGALLAMVGLLVFGAVKGVQFVRTPPDLAKGKPWKASSAYPGFSPATHICDGNTTNILFHTKEETNPWFEIDLGAPTAFRRIDVRNRGDGLRDRAVPLIAEVSDDHKTWREVAKRTAVFDTWVATFAPQKARYVRVRAGKKTFLHLENVAVR
jgi:hypothetical protein